MKNKCSDVNEVLFESAQPPHQVAFSSCWGLVDQQVLVQFRPEETAEGVFLHQGVDPLLGQVKGHGGELHQVSQSHILCEMINVDLQVEGRKANLSEELKYMNQPNKWNMTLWRKTYSVTNWSCFLKRKKKKTVTSLGPSGWMKSS